jgi:2-oxoglutarate dehydrogenase E1 component
MLRNPRACSPVGELETGRFREVLEDGDVGSAERVLVCTGKVAHELRQARDKLHAAAAIVRLEQLYPFPDRALAVLLDRCSAAREIVWVQEEPANMGALAFVEPRLELLAGGRPVRSVKRSPSASPATGSAKAHELEQQALLSLSFSPMRR